MGDQREASVGHHAMQELTPGRGGESRGKRGENGGGEGNAQEQDFQSRPVSRCGISIVHHRAGEAQGKED